LKATNTDIASGKYQIRQAPFFKEENSVALKIPKMVQQS